MPTRALLALVGLGVGVLILVLAFGSRGDGPPVAPSPHPATPAPAEAVAVEAPPAYQERIEYQGISVEVDIAPLGSETTLREGQDARFRFAIRDVATGKPLPAAFPAAWLDLRRPGEEAEEADPKRAIRKAEALINGNIFMRPELDLNVFRVLVLGEDATVTVVDPYFQFGGSKYLEVIPLPSPGADWVLSADQSLLLVTAPAAGTLSVIRTADWQILAELELGVGAARIVLQPDGHYAWVATAEEAVAVDVAARAVAGRIPLGPGSHALVCSSDGRHLYATQPDAGTLAVIDVHALRLAGRVPVGAQPSGLDYSPQAEMAYVACASGEVVAVDGRRLELVARCTVGPGLGPLRFAPGGRFAFVLRPGEDMLYVLDAASNRVARQGRMGAEPAKLAFSGQFGYVWHRRAAEVLMIPLAGLDAPGQPLHVAQFPLGRLAATQVGRVSVADTIVEAPGGGAVLAASPADKAVFYYKEGMAAPQGSFENDGREAQGVLVVDRSLRERRQAGVYETVGRLGRPGTFDLVFFLDAPRIIHCFELKVEPDPELQHARDAGKLTVELVEQGPATGEQASLRLCLRLRQVVDQEMRSGLEDVRILLCDMSGAWEQRVMARETEPGHYEAEFAPDEPDYYQVFVESRAAGLKFGQTPPLTLKIDAVAGEESR